MYYKFLLIVLVFSACSKEKFSTVEIYGHGGNGIEIQNSIYHDNSKESIELALSKEGVAGVEIDVRLSADGELWLYHDDELSSETNGSGCVEQMTSDELKDIQYSTAQKEKLVKLADLDFGNYGSKAFLIDARHYKGCDFSSIDYAQFVQALTALRIAHPNIQFIVLSRITEWIEEFKANGFEVYYEIFSLSDYDEIIDQDYEIEGVIVKNSLISKEEVHKIQNDSRKVIIFEMRSPKTIRKAMKKKPDGILSDDLNAAIIEKY